MLLLLVTTTTVFNVACTQQLLLVTETQYVLTGQLSAQLTGQWTVLRTRNRPLLKVNYYLLLQLHLTNMYADNVNSACVAQLVGKAE